MLRQIIRGGLVRLAVLLQDLPAGHRLRVVVRQHGGARHETHEAAVRDGARRQDQRENETQLLVVERPEEFQAGRAVEQAHAWVEQQHRRYEHPENRHRHVEADEQILVEDRVIEETNRADDDDADDADDECP